MHWTIHVIKCIERGHMKSNSWKYVVMWTHGERESLVRVLSQFGLSLCILILATMHWASLFMLEYPKTTAFDDLNIIFVICVNIDDNISVLISKTIYLIQRPLTWTLSQTIYFVCHISFIRSRGFELQLLSRSYLFYISDNTVIKHSLNESINGCINLANPKKYFIHSSYLLF